MLAIQPVVVVHHSCNDTAERLTIVIGLVNQVPDGVNEMACRDDVALIDFYLEVAHLSVESRWHLSCGKWHREICKESYAVELKTFPEVYRVNDGSRSQEHECARG